VRFLSIAMISLFISASLQAADRVFTGTTRLSQDTFYQSINVTFDNGAKIVTNGFRLTIEGTTSITFKGTPEIVAYEPRNMGPGESGRAAGIVIIKTPKLVGTSLKIDNLGEAGAAGSAGAGGPKGSKGGQGTQRDHNVINGCIGGSNGGQGGPGGDGTDGGGGGNGGSGGAVLIDIGSGCLNGAIERFQISVLGGAPGSGGAAGPAGPGGDGGDAAPGTFWCGGTSPGPPGPNGRAGRSGPAGSPGNSGPIFDIRNTCSTPAKHSPEAGSKGFQLKTIEVMNPQ
jgi:hypothetical protein